MDMPMRISITNCARCGKEHDSVLVREFDIAPPNYSHWATCPSSDQPLLIRVGPNKGADPKGVSSSDGGEDEDDFLLELKLWLESFLADDRFPDTLVEWDHYDPVTRQVFITVFGEWDKYMWREITAHISSKFQGTLVGIFRV